MDRFIVTAIELDDNSHSNLKSNMDRFIDTVGSLHKQLFKHLKSNMDRFIAKPLKFERNHKAI